jgi:tetratricopeptide (TPR) repeat protein
MDTIDPLNPQDASAYNNLGQYERAIQDYDEAIRLNPQVAMLYYNRGGSYEALGKTKEAERDFQKAKNSVAAFDSRNPAWDHAGSVERCRTSSRCGPG